MEPRAQTLKAGFDIAHMIFGGVVDGLTQAAVEKTFPGATIAAAGPILAHAIFDEDMMVASAFGQKTVLESQGLGGKTGITNPGGFMTPEWLASKYNLQELLAYSQAVFANTGKLLDAATATQLDNQVDTPFGKRSAADYLGSLGVVHLSSHIGEVSALKGLQGMKGLPF